MAGLLNPVVLRITLRATLGPQARARLPARAAGAAVITVALKAGREEPGLAVGVPRRLRLLRRAPADRADHRHQRARRRDRRRQHHPPARHAGEQDVRRPFQVHRRGAAHDRLRCDSRVPRGDDREGPADRLAVGLLAGAIVAAVAYNALFVMLSLLTTRAIAVGPAIPAGLGGPARQPDRRGQGAVGRPVLRQRRELDRQVAGPERAPDTRPRRSSWRSRSPSSRWPSPAGGCRCSR